MKKFAIDIVVLPPDPVMDLAIEWNRVLRKSHPTNIVLNNTHNLPHISMAMGCLPADQLNHASIILQSVASAHHVLALQAPDIKTVNTASGDRVASLDIAHSRELTMLHESIVTAFRPLLTQDVTEEDLNDAPPIDPSSLDWINHYIPDHCFQNFWPHITLGFGVLSDSFQPFSFHASRLAICHLGNYCTCSRVLAELFLEDGL